MCNTLIKDAACGYTVVQGRRRRLCRVLHLLLMCYSAVSPCYGPSSLSRSKYPFGKERSNHVLDAGPTR